MVRALICAAAALFAAARVVADFEKDVPGRPPSGFSFALTGRGKPGVWQVVRDPAGSHVLAQIDRDETSYRFPVAVLDGVTAQDVELTVRFKPISGSVDQAAGLVWRYRDENNYYIVRANALEGNVVLYKVENGRRADLPLRAEGRTYGRKVPVPSGQWSRLGVMARGDVFEVRLNGQRLFEVEDTTFTGAGKVGVWTKADSVTWFDDLSVAVK